MEEGSSNSTRSGSSIYICLIDERRHELLQVQTEQKNHTRVTLLGLCCLTTAYCAVILSGDQ
jgi:hypothetical protein